MVDTLSICFWLVCLLVVKVFMHLPHLPLATQELSTAQVPQYVGFYFLESIYLQEQPT